MTSQILLLRGVNVGGVRLAMQDLKEAIAAAGGENVRTYIQSGNAVFDGAASSPAIAEALFARTGLRVDLFQYSAGAFQALARDCPFATEGGARLHLFFLARPAHPAPGALEAVAKDEMFHLTPSVFYLLAPSGIGRSVLVDRLPRLLGVPMTARNWNTVTALIGLAQGDGPG